MVYYYLCYTNYSICYIDTGVSNASHFCIWHIDKVYAVVYGIVWLVLSVTCALWSRRACRGVLSS